MRLNKSLFILATGIILSIGMAFASWPIYANPYGTDLFVRGSMNNWSTANKMEDLGNNRFSAILVLPKGPLEFKVAEKDWQIIANFGADKEAEINLDSSKVLKGGGDNLKLSIPERAPYEFILDASQSETPTLMVKPAQVAIIHYIRKKEDYDGWGLHLWGTAIAPSEATQWDAPKPFTYKDEAGRYAIIRLQDPTKPINFIIHKGNEKDHLGRDMTLNTSKETPEIWMVEGSDTKFTEEDAAMIEAGAVGDLGKAQARWISRTSIIWELDEIAGLTPYLYYHPEGDIFSDDNGDLKVGPGGEVFQLTFNGFVGDGNDSTFDKKLAYLSYLEGRARIDTSTLRNIEILLTGRLAIALRNQAGQLVDATSLQRAGILDDFYTYSGPLGPIVEKERIALRLWAPTAQEVVLHLYDSPTSGEIKGSPIRMQRVMDRNNWTGVWELSAQRDSLLNRYYAFGVKVIVRSGELVTNLVTDPYSLSLSTNSTRSQIVDLDASQWKPQGWDNLQKPDFGTPEDIVIYELHLRDFSISDQTVPEKHRGTYMAFTETQSNGMKHLTALAEAGLTHLHLQPLFDIGTIEEDRRKQKLPQIPTMAAPDSSDQQAAIAAVKASDPFNWGYDPYHYTTPEGSYATQPDGGNRLLEFRQMVKALNAAGLRVVMDVVYNHTNASGQNDRSVLDKVVPGYYHRLDNDGNVQTSTCCEDTATEHNMMEKLMIDSLITWTRDYKIDGFRFDLMGHHTTTNMKNVRGAIDSLTMENDGVDGKNVYVYGEAWRFGSLDGILTTEAAHQVNMYGLNIGSFNDRIRDSARGGSVFDHPSNQGFLTGLYYDPNEAPENSGMPSDAAGRKQLLLNHADNVRIGMAGNLRDYRFMGYEGKIVTGADINYRGNLNAGYAASPKETINYISVHDNYTLWDYIQAKAAFRMTSRDPQTEPLQGRVRMQNLGLSTIALGQGIPFFHAGSDMLRSKSGDTDSYNSGDWFNVLDFTYERNNWGVGLPIAEKNEGQWPFWGPRLADTAITPKKPEILKAVEHFREMLRIRKSSPLFRLRTADDIKKRVQFLNAELGTDQIPGLIVMTIADDIPELADLDRGIEFIAIVLNATTQAVTFQHEEFKGRSLRLHPIQQQSVDVIVKATQFVADTGTVVIPNRTTAVLVQTR